MSKFKRRDTDHRERKNNSKMGLIHLTFLPRRKSKGSNIKIGSEIKMAKLNRNQMTLF